MRKRLFCDAKPTLLPCKRAAFRMQNNRFYNTLIIRLLRNSDACEKYLHLYLLFSACKWVFQRSELVLLRKLFPFREVKQ
ncbi:hypothetical protein CTM62_00215 [Prevotella intermedia]|uniref:Uncharacterized protein n=1 Tax=Prevotella intermedia TaxID=28131 RepID=A0A2D3L400_PREIN|nr:hypothetical protein CTM62_00215 [Prevotella intermedia]